MTAGAATAFYAFIGFEDSVNMAEEVRNPVRRGSSGPVRLGLAPAILPVIGALVALVFLLPINQTAEIYRIAILLLLGGLACGRSTSW